MKRGHGVWNQDLELELLRHFDSLRLEVLDSKCAHTLADIRNDAIKSGYACIKCGALFAAADH